MDIGTGRDIVIVILGILYIIITIGIIVGIIIVYSKIRKMFRSVNETLYSVRKWIAYVRGLFKGLTESVNIFRREGG